MSELQHYCVMTSLLRPFDAANDAVTPTFSDVVLASDAEAAIAAAEQRGIQKALTAWQEAEPLHDMEVQRDMLARCIAAVEGMPVAIRHPNVLLLNRALTIAALRGLGGGDE